VATPHTELKHAPALFTAPRRLTWIRSGLLVGAAAALTVTALPGAASAAPGDATSTAQVAQLVADANHQLEVVTEQVNEAKVQLDQQQAAVAAADQAATAAQSRFAQLEPQIRQLARSAYTNDGLTRLNVMLTSNSADDFVHQLGTLDAIAGHTNQQVAGIAAVAVDAKKAQTAAAAAQAKAQKTYDGVAAQQKDLQAKIADYQRQYSALSAPQQQAVRTVSSGAAQPVPTAVAAPSGAAQKAVDTALAHVGDPYVWGAAGPHAFDCSGLTQYAYSAAGVSLPHSAASQSRMGTPVSRDQLQPGDLVFFYSPVSHVGMYIGNGQMVHASTSGEPVKVVSLDSMPGFNSARRLG
jgi:cell wall-associated NlpC family hydrolase